MNPRPIILSVIWLTRLARSWIIRLNSVNIPVGLIWLAISGIVWIRLDPGAIFFSVWLIRLIVPRVYWLNSVNIFWLVVPWINWLVAVSVIWSSLWVVSVIRRLTSNRSRTTNSGMTNLIIINNTNTSAISGFWSQEAQFLMGLSQES